MNNFRKSQHMKQDNLMIDLPCTIYIDNLTKLQQSCGIQIIAIWAPWNPSIHNIDFAYVPNKSLFWVLLFLWFQQVLLGSTSNSRMFHVLDPSPLGKFSTTLDHNLDNFLWYNPSHATLGIQALHKQSFAKS